MVRSSSTSTSSAHWLGQSCGHTDIRLGIPGPTNANNDFEVDNVQGDSISSWLKTLLTDAFYWTDHDLVVQTRSMYGGSPRRTASTFVLDQGGTATTRAMAQAVLAAYRNA